MFHGQPCSQSCHFEQVILMPHNWLVHDTMTVSRPPAGFGASGMLSSAASSIPGSELARLPMLIWAAVAIPAAGPVEGAAVIVCPPGADRMPDSCVRIDAYTHVHAKRSRHRAGLVHPFHAGKPAPPSTCREEPCSWVYICLSLQYCLTEWYHWESSGAP